MAKRSLSEGVPSKPFSFRLSEPDADALTEKVKAAGLSISEFMREYVLLNKTSVIARRPASGDKRKLLYLFNKASNNINQLAKQVNVAHKAGDVSEDIYLEVLKELQHLSRYMKGCLNDVD
ncbi:plasmid mobilization protein (plasmid) [Methylocaldum gracile subsp. desertum]|uniref:plasmid mobilization protein n=1 Tax=Methylocaldum sp. GT1BW TaxID=3438964 RepID=UPI003DA158FE